MPSIPNLPGDIVPPDSPHQQWLKSTVASLCQLDNVRFPGSQPVSFSENDLEKLEKLDFWVCEKSDGVRVLLFVNTDLSTNVQNVYLIDRHNTYRQLDGLFFPHHEDPRRPLRNTLIDGELVIDVDPRTKGETMRYLAFDCLAVDDQNVMARPLDKRYGRLKEWFSRPYQRMIADHPHMAAHQPFQIQVKKILFSYHADEVFAQMPTLQHDSDGLIYTCVTTPYIPGTDNNLIKWKPPSENSIDFKLVLKFPPIPGQPDAPDFHAKPEFLLYVWYGDDRGQAKYELYDGMYVTDDEWESMKRTGEQIDDRVVEVHWDPQFNRWRMMRFRDDKPNGNHKSVVEKIIQSIADGVEKDVLLARSNAIRTAWKQRHGQHNQPMAASHAHPSSFPSAHPQPHQQQHPHAHLPPRPQTYHPPPLLSGHSRPSIGQPSTPSSRPPPPPPAVFRYGPMEKGRWSKVTGPPVIAGMQR